MKNIFTLSLSASLSAIVTLSIGASGYATEDELSLDSEYPISEVKSDAVDYSEVERPSNQVKPSSKKAIKQFANYEQDKSCEGSLKSYLYRQGYKTKFSSIWVGNYIQCPIEDNQHEEICLMRATFYPRGKGSQKTENFLVGTSTSLNSKVYTANEIKLTETGYLVKLDLKPVGYSQKAEKVMINRKKLQVTLANKNIVSQCVSKSLQGDFLKF